MKYVVLILSYVVALNVNATSFQKATLVDDDCLGNFQIVENAKTKNPLGIFTIDETNYMMAAMDKALELGFKHQIKGKEIVSADLKDLSSYGQKLFGAKVVVCDNAEPGQGNCLQVYFQMTDPKYSVTPKVSVVRENWHTGKNQAFLVCE